MPARSPIQDSNLSTGSSAPGARLAGAMPDDLSAVRAALLAPEQAAIRKIQHRLDDPATRAAETAAALPAALGLAAADSAALVEQLKPLIREALAEVLRQQPDLAARRGETRRRSWRNPLGTLAGGMGRLLWRWRRRKVAARIEQLYLVRQSDGELLEHIERPPTVTEDAGEAAYQEGHRMMRSMATYLLAALRDPRVLGRYVMIKSLRVEQFVYGFHADGERVLLSVILAGDRVPADELIECERILASTSGGDGSGRMLPAFGPT